MGDPWTLELFQKNSNTESKDKRAGILITEKGNIHVIKQPEPETITTFLSPKIKRSLSQPSVSSIHRTRYGVLNFKQSTNTLTLNNLNESNSHFYLYSVLWACIAILFWKNVMLLPILPIPIIIYIVKHLGIYLGVWQWIFNYWIKILDIFNRWFDDRYNALVPIHIRGLCKITYDINYKLKQGIKGSIDTVSSCVVIFGLIIFVICATIFLAIQVSFT